MINALPNQTLQARIEEFVKVADQKAADEWTRAGYIHSKPPIHQAQYLSEKWVRVVNLEDRGGERAVTSVYAFIALQDGYTKALGAIKAGDVHKPASFKTPAKHARGNVFDDDFGKWLTSHGPVYLK